MPSVNHVMLLGNLTRDPEIHEGEKGTAVRFDLALDRVWTDADGQRHEEVDYIPVVVFGRQGDYIREYAQKGSLVHVEGRLSQSTWEHEGQRRSRIEVIAERVQGLARLKEKK